VLTLTNGWLFVSKRTCMHCRWVASSDNAHHNGGFCNYDWPAADMPAQAKPIVPDPEDGLAVSVDALAWVYVWPEVDAL
jgi:hypothetical protein